MAGLDSASGTLEAENLKSSDAEDHQEFSPESESEYFTFSKWNKKKIISKISAISSIRK